MALTIKDLQVVIERIEHMFPEAECELKHRNPFELLVAVVLSAQATDALVNKVTPGLFEQYSSPQDFAEAPLEDIEQSIRSIGLYRNKAKNLKKLSFSLLERHDGHVPETQEELVELAGVGRKTANVVASVAFGVPAIAVDTHVERVSKRLGICRWKDNVTQVEQTLMKRLPKEKWSQMHHQLIFFGRYHCKSQAPQCPSCPVLDYCREGQKRMRKEGAAW